MIFFLLNAFEIQFEFFRQIATFKIYVIQAFRQKNMSIFTSLFFRQIVTFGFCTLTRAF